MLRFFCTLCGQPMVANETRTGMTATCPGCKGTVTVPAAAAVLPSAGAATPMTPQAGPPPVPARSAPVTGASPSSAAPPPDTMAPDEFAPSSLPKKKNVGIWWLLAVLATGIALVVSISTVHVKDGAAPPAGMSPAAHHAAQVMGLSIAHFLEILLLTCLPALIVAVICQFSIKSFLRPLVIAYAAGMLGWAFVFVTVPSMGDPHFARRAGSDSKPSKEFEKRVEETAKKMIETRKVPEVPALALPPKPTGPITSDLDRWNELCREVSADAATIGPDYNKELEAAGYNRLILPDRIMADKNFTESRAIIEASQRAVHRASQRVKDIFKSLDKKLEDLHLAPESAAQARESMQRTVGKLSGPMQEFYGIEEKIVDHFVESARYLDFIRPYWTVEDRRGKYQRQADQEHIRGITQHLKDDRARQEEIKKYLTLILATKIEEAKDRESGK